MRGLILTGLVALASVANAAGGFKLRSISTTTFAGVSYTALPITLTAIAQNGTQPLAIKFSCEGAATGVYWRIAPVNVVPTSFHYYAVSTTPILVDNLEKNQCLWVKSSSSAAHTLVLDVFEQLSPGY